MLPATVYSETNVTYPTGSDASPVIFASPTTPPYANVTAQATQIVADPESTLEAYPCHCPCQGQ